MGLERWLSNEHFLFSSGHKFSSWHSHTFIALLVLMLFVSFHKGKHLKEDVHFLSLAAIEYAHGHHPDHTFSNALITQVHSWLVYPGTPTQPAAQQVPCPYEEGQHKCQVGNAVGSFPG